MNIRQSHLNFAAKLQEFLTGSLDALVDSVGNDPRILFTPSLLDKDRWHLDLMIANYFIGPSTEDHETCRCGALVYSTNKRPHQGSLCFSCITRRASIIHFERACYLLLLRDAVRTNTNWNNTYKPCVSRSALPLKYSCLTCVVYTCTYILVIRSALAISIRDKAQPLWKGLKAFNDVYYVPVFYCIGDTD